MPQAPRLWRVEHRGGDVLSTAFLPDYFTPEQVLATETSGHRLAIVASAGSGKTGVLVARYLRHVLQEGLSPDSILALTFTRKAAAEMRERTCAKLQELGREEDARRAETGPIETIDAWVHATLRMVALDLGVDPQFGQLDGLEKSLLFRQAFLVALAEVQDDVPGSGAWIGSLVGGNMGNPRNEGPYAELMSMVERWIEGFRGAGVTPVEIEATHASPDSLLESVLATFESQVPAVVEIPERSDQFLSDLRDAYKLAKVRLPSYLEGKPLLEEMTEGLVASFYLAQLSIRTWRGFEYRMAREQKFDFNRQSQLLMEGLRDHERVRQRVRRTFRRVLVDEAQDVSPLQQKLLEAADFEELVYIGDPKQSIYGFRDADVRQFRETTGAYPQLTLGVNHRSTKPIQQFVDSTIGVALPDYVNFVQEPVDLDDNQRPTYDGVEVWTSDERPTFLAELADRLIHARAQWRSELADPTVTVLVRGNKEGEQLEQLLLQRGQAVRMVRGIKRLHTRLEARDLANLLIALAHPKDDYSLLCVLRGPVVRLSMDSVLDLARSSPVSEALSSYEPFIPEDAARLEAFRKWFEPLAARADRLPAAELIGEIFSRTPFLEGMASLPNGMQAVANLRKLLLEASGVPEVGPVEYAETIRGLTQTREGTDEAVVLDPDPNEIEIMTIHSAKGLERDCIVLASAWTDADPRVPDLLVDAQLGLALLKEPVPLSQQPAYRLLHDRRRSKETDEQSRLLYVALTRARKRLVVCAAAVPKKLGAEVLKPLGMTPEKWASHVSVSPLNLQAGEE